MKPKMENFGSVGFVPFRSYRMPHPSFKEINKGNDMNTKQTLKNKWVFNIVILKLLRNKNLRK